MKNNHYSDSKTAFLVNPIPIAGFRYYAGPADIPGLSPGTRLALRPQPANPHDNSAVEIFHGPLKLGYVPRHCNGHISRLLQDGIPVACNVARVDLNAPPWDAVSVRISLPFRSGVSGERR